MRSKILLPIVLVVVVLAVLAAFTGFSPLMYVDPPSFFVVPFAPLLYMVLAFGGKAFASAFRAPRKDGATRRELAASAAFFRNLGCAMWVFGALGSACALIAVLANLTDKARIGPNVAVALITLLYAALFNAVLVLPFRIEAERRLAETE